MTTTVESPDQFAADLWERFVALQQQGFTGPQALLLVGQNEISPLIKPEQWAQLRAPFPPDQLEKLPQAMRKGDEDKGSCVEGSKYSADGYFCGKFHVRSIHLDYVGHAGITMRLLDVDPLWNWEPMVLSPAGTPYFSDEGMWIKLTVLGVTRIGFGDAGGKRGANATKETIGDAIRNAAMRFGVGTYLWSKSEYAEALKQFREPSADEILSEARSHAWGVLVNHYRQDLTREEAARWAAEQLHSDYDVTPETATAEHWRSLAEQWEAAEPILPPPPAASDQAANSATPPPAGPLPGEPSGPSMVEHAGPLMVTPKGLQVLGIQWKESGVTDDLERITYTGIFVGRQISSTKELTKDEADRLTKWLRKIKTREQLEVAINEIADRRENQA